MDASTWIALGGFTVILGGIGLRGIMKATRMVDALEKLPETIARAIADHELRLHRDQLNRRDRIRPLGPGMAATRGRGLPGGLHLSPFLPRQQHLDLALAAIPAIIRMAWPAPTLPPDPGALPAPAANPLAVDAR